MSVEPVFIVVIDDSDADAALIQLAARRSKAPTRFRHFLNGPAALEYLNDPVIMPPDLILLDVHMPGMSGHDVLEEIRQMPRLATTPVLVLSSTEDEPDSMGSHDDYVTAEIVKPIGVHGFQVVIETLDSCWSSRAVPPPQQVASDR